MLLSIYELDGGNKDEHEILIGKDIHLLPYEKPEKYVIDFSKYTFQSTQVTITLRKLSTAEPMGPGISTKIFKASTF